jgi:hypothetical protein
MSTKLSGNKWLNSVNVMVIAFSNMVVFGWLMISGILLVGWQIVSLVSLISLMGALSIVLAHVIKNTNGLFLLSIFYMTYNSLGTFYWLTIAITGIRADIWELVPVALLGFISGGFFFVLEIKNKIYSPWFAYRRDLDPMILKGAAND